jgi:hypothetical protein
MPNDLATRSGSDLSQRAYSVLRDQQIDMEMMAANLRNDPQLHGLTSAEGRQLANIFDSAARVLGQV